MSNQEAEAYGGNKAEAYLEKARQDILNRVVSTLESLESNELTAYVPTDKGKPIDESGVTVGMGADIGQLSSTELYNLDIPRGLKQKLNPFTDKKGNAALKALSKNPVTLTKEEVDSLNKAIKRKELLVAERNVKRETGKSLYDLPPSFRTGLVIQSFQLGNQLFRNPKTKKPTNFRQQVIEGRYDDAADNMFTWNEKALPGLRKRYKALGDLMKGNIQLSEVPEAAEFYLNSIRKGRNGNIRFQEGTPNKELEPLPPTYSTMQDPIEQAGVRTVQPEQQEEDGGLMGIINSFKSRLGF